MSEVARLAKEKLRSTPYRELHRLKCLEQDGTLILQGNVTTFHMKQLAQQTVMPVCQRLQNDVQVGMSKNS